MRYNLKRCWMLILSGLDEEERETSGVNYKEGEVLDRKAFDKQVKMGDRLFEIYPALCEGHK